LSLLLLFGAASTTSPPAFVADTTFNDDTPAANSQATGSIAFGANRLYIISVLLMRGASTNPLSATLSGWGVTWTAAADHLSRDTGTTRSRHMTFWGITPGSGGSSALTVDYTGMTPTGLSMTIDYTATYEASDPIVAANTLTSGTQNLVGGATTSYYTHAALTHVDNRVWAAATQNGNTAGFDFEVNYTNLSTVSSGTVPVRRAISGWRNSATPDLTPAVTEASSWVVGVMSLEVRGFGTLGGDAETTPSAIALSAVTTAPTSVTGGGTIEPAAIALTATTPAPTSVTGGGTTAPAAIALVAVLSAPTSVTGGGTTAPAAVELLAVTPEPTATGGAGSGDGTATPAAVALTVSLSAPTVTGSADTAPAAVALTATTPAPTVTGGATTAPAAVALTATLGAPTTTGGAITSPAAIARLAVTPAPTVTGGAITAPAAVALTAVTPAPTATGAGDGAGNAVPSAIPLTASLTAPTVTGGANTAPAAITRTAVTPAPTVTGGATVTAAELLFAALLGTPTATGGSSTAPAGITLLAVVPDPTATGSAPPQFTILVDGIEAWGEPAVVFFSEASTPGWREPVYPTYREPKATAGTS
jgi:hypothetical protein